jgi:hypothetical protein
MQLPTDQMSLYFEVITDREVILFKSQSAEAVELWMSIENHMNRDDYALNSLDPADLPDSQGAYMPMVNLLDTFGDAVSIPVDCDEDDLLALAEAFLRQHGSDFPSSIIFYPPKVA